MKKYFAQKGFIALLPLLVISFLVVSGFAIYSQGASETPSQVLSETSENEEEQSREQTQIRLANESEGDQIRIETQNREREIEEENETPEPEETAEPEETPEPEEFEEEEEFEVREGANKSKIKIRSGKNKFEFQQEGTKFSVESDFPLSVNPTTRELTVTTPAGTRVVAVLPQQAIDNMLAVGIVTTTTEVGLKTESDGSLSYDIDGAKNEKLLGVFDVAVPKNLIVSAQTGQVLTVNQSVFSKILDFLSI